MRTKCDAKLYDFFKLIVTLILLVVLLMLLSNRIGIQPTAYKEDTQPVLEDREVEEQSAAELHLPPLPETGIALEYDQTSGNLITISGTPHFELNTAGDGWLPILPDELLAQLPSGFRMTQDESNIWAVVDSNGSPLFSLEYETLQWMPIASKASIAQEPTIVGVPDCPKAKPARISATGVKVRVVNALIPLRSSPQAGLNNILRDLPIGTELEVIAMPVCTEYLDGANLWWQVRLLNGLSGWAAEGSAISPTYYLEVFE
ncbi:MAG TPA: SH3 domain-containing protein [Anaerolineae bacterium]|nr:SH3 domain-containing protein [Anaerolineae bacterium]